MPVGCLGNNSNNDQKDLKNQSSVGFHLDEGGGNGNNQVKNKSVYIYIYIYIYIYNYIYKSNDYFYIRILFKYQKGSLRKRH